MAAHHRCPICREPMPKASRDRRVASNGIVVCGRATCEQRADEIPTCVGPDCTRPGILRVEALGALCASHYAAARRHPGRPLRALGRPVQEREERRRLTVRVDDATFERLRARGSPATVASEVLRRWKP